MRFASLSLCLVLLVAVCRGSTIDYETEFVNWMGQHNIAYDISEFFTRFHLFTAKLDQIIEHNAANSSWTQGTNQFTASTADEMASILTYRQSSNAESQSNEETKHNLQSYQTQTNPTSVNWVTANKVSAIKNQGNCGSCWSFSSTGAIEIANAIKHNTTVIPLSEQQLIDCSTSYGNQGCNGGSMYEAFAYTKANGGLASEAAYPYKYVNGVTSPASTCQSSTIPKTSTIQGFTQVASNNAQALENAVVLGGVSVAIDASGSQFQSYSSGVFTGSCGTSLDHGVLVVGYGVDSVTGLSYWLVKNSWGTWWGENGYIRMQRITNSTGLCGIQMQPIYPTVTV